MVIGKTNIREKFGQKIRAIISIFLEIAPAMTIAPFAISPFVISFVACIVSCTPINALSIGFKVSARMPSVKTI
jgi:hypothetical protein